MIDLRRLAFPTVRSLTRWEGRRTKGFLRFVFFRGVLLFGGLMYLAISVLFVVEKWGTLPLVPSAGGSPLLGATLFVVAGVAWGGSTWLVAELVYASHRKSPIRF